MSAQAPAEETPLRLFCALWPDDVVRNGFARVVRDMSREVRGRWVSLRNLHITLAFLGDVPAGRISDLAAMIQSLDPPEFELILDRLEFWRHNRILCLGAAATPPALLDLVQHLNAGLIAAGFEVERRPFRAHVTLARKAEAEWSKHTLREAVVWPVTRVVLMESLVSNTGSTYIVRAERQLRAMPEMPAMK